MQPLQEEVKKDVITHPFRNIEIVYEAGKTTRSAQDEELITGYTGLHDFEQEMKNTAEELHRKSGSINETLKELREELAMVREKFEICCQLADKLSETSYSVEETSLEKLAYLSGECEEKLKDYYNKLIAVYERAKVVRDKINEYNENSENRSEAVYEKFTTLVMNHAVNWENNAIDIVDFDQKFDQFREYLPTTQSYREYLVEESESAMTNYTNLNNESTALYNLWNEFTKRSHLLVKMSHLKNDATGFTEN
jgi:hypothetical protein